MAHEIFTWGTNEVDQEEFSWLNLKEFYMKIEQKLLSWYSYKNVYYLLYYSWNIVILNIFYHLLWLFTNLSIESS